MERAHVSRMCLRMTLTYRSSTTAFRCIHIQYYVSIHVYIHVYTMYIQCTWVLCEHLHVYMYYDNLQESMRVAFQKADDYRQKFEPYREFYCENEALDVEKFKEEDHGQCIHYDAHTNLLCCVCVCVCVCV